MLRKTLVTATAMFCLTLPALAQFPPPGIYDCSKSDGTAFGTLTLFVAGDYDFVTDDMPRGQGQVASSGPQVQALSGPLADIELRGSFVTDDRGDTEFDFTTSKGAIHCALPPR
jgi:hypothetical protein